MAKQKRNAVFVALSHTVGHELVFRHYTNKVVAAIFPNANHKPELQEKRKETKRTKRKN